MFTIELDRDSKKFFVLQKNLLRRLRTVSVLRYTQILASIGSVRKHPLALGLAVKHGFAESKDCELFVIRLIVDKLKMYITQQESPLILL